MREIRERDDAAAAHACGFAQHGFGVAQVLQRVDLQHQVEGIVLEQRQAFVQIELDHVDAGAHAGQHMLVADLDAVAGTVAACAQQRQQLALATAQVQHARALGHQACDRLVQRSGLGR